MQIFNRLFWCALLVGLCGGLVHSAVQHAQVLPLIAAAEVFEAAAESAPHEHEHEHATGSHEAHEHEEPHDHGDAWAPADGLERNAFTVLANVLAGTGYALVLLPLMALWDRRRGGRAASARSGALWGAAGWFCLFAWPAIGLPPELPGTAAADLHARQAWWLLAVLCAVAAIGLAALGGRRLGHARWLGLALLALPFAIGAPQVSGSLYPGQPADAAAQLQALNDRFVLATALATALYWLVLGTVAGMVTARWLRPLLAAGDAAAPSPRLTTP
jgi:cobalt transporter subunit CbtA